MAQDDDHGPPQSRKGSDTAERQRRERKRQSDRLAQREHRKRQKLYIEQLESQLKILKSTDQSETTRLATENFRMREELTQMHLLWDEMEILLQKQRKLREQSVLKDEPRESVSQSEDGQLDIPEQEDDFEAELQIFNDDNEAANPAHADPAGNEDPLSMTFEDQPHMFGDGAHNLPETISELPRFSDTEQVESVLPIHQGNGNSLWLNLERTGGPSDLPFQTDAVLSAQSSRAQESAHTHLFNFHLFDDIVLPDLETQQNDDGVQNLQQRPERRNTAQEATSSTQSLELFTQRSISPLRLNSWLLDAFKSSEALPLLMFPPLPGDKHIHAILERARENIHAIGPPYIIDFLVDNPRNTLSTDLKTLLAPIRRTRGTSEFFATYWILYLLLRWQVKRDDETYNSLPSWMRPTPLQLTVLHPFAADLIAWPEIREALIQMAMSDSQRVHEVSLDIGRYLTVDIHVSDMDLSDPQQISAQISNLANWKLDREFFTRYPEWKILEKRHLSPEKEAV